MRRLLADEGYGGVDLTPLLNWATSPTGLLTIGVLLAVLVAIVSLVAVLGYRAVRRRLPAGERLVDRAMTSWRAQSLPAGPRRDLAELRSRLARSLSATDRQLHDADATGAPVGQLPALAGQLSSTGQRLAGHLRLLEGEPDDARLLAALPAATEHVNKLCSAASAMREAARAAALAVSAGEQAELLDAAQLEIAAVGAGVNYLREQADPGRSLHG